MGNAALKRRATQRLPTEIEVDIHGETNFYTGFSANISEGGIFVATYRQQSIGDRLRIRVRLPDADEALEATVEVRWLRETRAEGEGAPGFGAAFVELSDAARGAIENFIAVRAPLFFEV